MCGFIAPMFFVLTGFVPLCFNHPFTITLLSSISGVTDDVLLQSFLNFIHKFESDALKGCLDGEESNINQIVIPMLSRFGCATKPTTNNIRELILKTAKHALVNQPYFVLCEVKRGMMDAHPKLWQRFTPELACDLLLSLKPTPQRVWGMIVEPVFKNCQTKYFRLLEEAHFSTRYKHLGESPTIHHGASSLWSSDDSSRIQFRGVTVFS